MKKLVVLFSAAFCLCAMNKANSQVVDSGTTGSCTWTLTGSSGNYTLTISGNGAMGDYGEAASPWYSYNSDIKTLDIQQGVTSIGDHAFNYCRGLTGTLTIPNSVTSIGMGAFRGCSGLTSVIIGNSVTTIGFLAFYECTDLTDISVDVNNLHYSSISGVLFNKLQDTLIQCPIGKSGSYTIPNSVTTIGGYAFYGCSGLTSITIPNSITSIGYYAFGFCSGLTSITIPNSVTTIGEEAFVGCSGLTSVTIPNSVTVIEEDAFSDCTGLMSIDVDINNTHYSSIDGVLFNKLQDTLIQCPGGKSGSYTIPGSVTTIGDGAFAGCSGLTSVTIPNSVTTIGGYAFYGCSGLTSVTIGNSVTTIGGGAFYDCTGLTSVIIPNSVTTIEHHTFYGCSGLTSVIIGNSVTSIGGQAFENCTGLTSITIPHSVTSIGYAAFENCSGLTSVIIGNSVTSIGGRAFYDCTGLTEMYIKAGTPPVLDYFSTFQGVTASIPVHVPCGTATAYQNAQGWDYFTNFIEDILPVLSVQSSDNTMGTVNITRVNTCADNTAVVEAAANTGYRFVQWNDGNTQNPRTVTVTQDITYTAEFASAAAGMFHVTVNANNPSMGTVTGGGDYATNSTATIEAIANQGYHFVQWNDGNTDNPRTLTVTQDTAFTAEFEVGVGITELETSAVAIYPNPATDNIVISLRENITNAVFTLYDMQGRVLIRRNITNEEVISVNEFAAGVYIYNVSTAKGNLNGKIVVGNN